MTTSLTSASAKRLGCTDVSLAAPASQARREAARAFREALGRFATGVAFITAIVDDEPAGLVVNSLASVSLHPPLVSFCPSRNSLTWSRIRRTGRFGANVLGAQHAEWATRAAPAGANRFGGLEWELGRGGVPLLSDALAHLECEIVGEHPAGDHWITVGRVEELHLPAAGDPLVFFAGAFHAVRPIHPTHPTIKEGQTR